MLNLFIAGLLLPLVASLLLFRRPRRPFGGWIATFLLALGMAGFSFFAVPWGLIGVWLRYVMGAMFVIALIVSLARKPDDRADDTPPRMILKALIGFFFGSVAAGVVNAHKKPPGAVDLAFPFAGSGTYTVVHGGSTNAANTYFGKGAQGFAVDIVGGKANDTVVMPCDGAIVSPKPLRVRCGNVTVEMTTAEATAGGEVKRGVAIGRMTDRYLHLFAEREQTPVPVTFDGRWLVRNAVILKRSEGSGREGAR